MKKLFAVLLSAALLAVSAAGCSGGASEAASSQAASSQAASEAAEPAASEAAEPAASEAAEPAASEEATGEAGTSEDLTIRVGAFKGPTAMGMVKLMEDNEAGTSANHYEFTVMGSVDEVTPKLLQGELDIAALPANLSSVLYNNSNAGIQVTNINTLGVLYIVETGDTVHSVADLKGKTIYASG